MKRSTKTDLPIRRLYPNGLDTDRFARMLDQNAAACSCF